MAARYRVKITTSGFIYILITIVLSVAAINTGNNLLYLISSLMLALMALSGMVSLANLFLIGLSVRPAVEVFEDIPARFGLTIEKRFGSSFFLTLETAFGLIRLPWVRRRAEHALWLKFPKRGRVVLEGIDLHSGFPLGFFRRSMRFPAGGEVMVFPRPEPCPLPSSIGGRHGSERRSESLFSELGDETKGLREHRSSDPLKWVDWKATARRGKMVAREFYRLEGDTLLIDLSNRTGTWEEQLSKACFLIMEGHRRRLSVGLRLPGTEIGPGSGEGHRRSLLEALCLA